MCAVDAIRQIMFYMLYGHRHASAPWVLVTSLSIVHEWLEQSDVTWDDVLAANDKMTTPDTSDFESDAHKRYSRRALSFVMDPWCTCIVTPWIWEFETLDLSLVGAYLKQVGEVAVNGVHSSRPAPSLFQSLVQSVHTETTTAILRTLLADADELIEDTPALVTLLHQMATRESTGVSMYQLLQQRFARNQRGHRRSYDEDIIGDVCTALHMAIRRLVADGNRGDLSTVCRIAHAADMLTLSDISAHVADKSLHSMIFEAVHLEHVTAGVP
jgi:hypothetical protein